MCGICGILGAGDKALTKDMMRSLKHRGPDDSGIHIDDNISLGHRRLSIIDLSERGRQPLTNEDSSVWITYNGETYNYRELRAGLEDKGHEFASDTDTEVIVHCYEEYGLDFVKKLRGQAAFALWDAGLERLVLVRDRLGIKPLYYGEVGGNLVFASELKAFLSHGGFTPRLNYAALDDYLTFQYIPEPATILEGVYKMQPAEMRVYEGGDVKSIRYWDLRLDAVAEKTEGQCVAELKERLLESIRMRLISDVPLGVELSGGIDSAAMTALMTDLVEEPVKTFTIGYGDAELDEVHQANAVAEHLSTDHHEILIDADEVLGELDKIIWHLDEPVGDPAQLPEYFLAKHIKEHVTVVFNGGGSDEVFAGYRAYKYLISSEKLRDIVPQTMRNILKPFGSLPLPARHRRYIDYVAAEDGEKVYWGQGLLFDEEERMNLYSNNLRKKTSGNDPKQRIKRHLDEKKGKSSHPLNQFSYVDLKGWVTGNCLSKLDRVTMAHAVECRVPYLDHELVEYAMTIPPKLKLTGGLKKYILRKTMQDRLPQETVRRPKKGFGVPTHQWLFDDVNDVVTERLTTSKFIKENFKGERIRHLLADKGLRRSSQLFGLLVLDMWHEKYIRGGR